VLADLFASDVLVALHVGAVARDAHNMRRLPAPPAEHASRLA
jgi:hypothetical protein